jgi:hypothetical protein
MQSESRNGARVRVLAVHTTEGMMRAKDLRDWAGWSGSSHASADETGVLMTPADGFVPYDRASWTLRSGNHWSENIELCAWARYTRAEWLARPKLLEACAQWLADRSKARGIPLVKLTPAQYRAGQSGVIGHVDHTIGYSDGSHTDPGPNFPYDVVLARAQAIANGSTTEDDLVMDAEVSKELFELRRMDALGLGVQIGDKRGPGERTPGEQVFERTLVNEFGQPEQFANLISRLNIDLRNDLQYKGQQITALVAANGALAQLVAQQNGLTVADVEAAVARAVADGVDVDVTVTAS